jgi:hypothetical protein
MPTRRTKGVGAEPVSPLGQEIEDAVLANARYARHDYHARMCTFRTRAGTVFAFERVTKNAINFWLLPTAAVEAAARHEGIRAVLRVPCPTGGLYGRLHALKSIHELKDQPLLRVPVRSAPQAERILAALL